MPGKPGQRKEERRSLFRFKKPVRKRFGPVSYWKRKRQQKDSISDTQIIEVAEVVQGVEETTEQENEAETASDCEATTDSDSPSFTTSHTSQHNVPIPLESKANPFNLDHDYGSKIGSQPSGTDHDYCCNKTASQSSKIVDSSKTDHDYCSNKYASPPSKTQAQLQDRAIHTLDSPHLADIIELCSTKVVTTSSSIPSTAANTQAEDLSEFLSQETHESVTKDSNDLHITLHSKDQPDILEFCSAEVVTSSSSTPSTANTLTEDPSEFVFQEIQKHLPPHWRVTKDSIGLNITLHSKDQSRVIQRSIFVSFSSGKIEKFAHGHNLLPDESISPLNASTQNSFIVDLRSWLQNFREKEICIGINNPKFKVWWKSSLDFCHIDNNSFHEVRYTTTLRSNECDYLINQPKKFCKSCQQINSKFAQRKSPSRSTSEKKTPNKYKPLKHLTSTEKKARQKSKSKNIRNLQRQVSRLKQQIDSLISKEGRKLSKRDANSLGNTLERGLKEIKLKDSQDPRDKFLEIFIQQQLAAKNAKGNHGINWHPLMIRYALQLKFHSQSSLNSSRSFIRLPSDRLLWDYTHIYDVVPGVQQDFVSDTAEKVANMKHEFQSYHVVSFDEINIKEGLVQRKTTGEMIGYCKLTEVQTELNDLRLKLQAEAEGTALQPSTPPIAKKMLTYMVRGTASNIQACIASYPVSTLCKEDLYQYTWEVTEALEVAGVKVVAFVSDGSPVNRSFFQMHPPDREGLTSSGLVFKTPNPYDPGRPIFFIPDPPHALKTTRNCLENSGRKKSRKLMKNGEPMTWKPIVRLYKFKSEQTIKSLPKLTAACVYLNSYSRMSVPYACRVVSNSVSSKLDLMGWPQTKELSIFKNY